MKYHFFTSQFISQHISTIWQLKPTIESLSCQSGHSSNTIYSNTSRYKPSTHKAKFLVQDSLKCSSVGLHVTGNANRTILDVLSSSCILNCFIILYIYMLGLFVCLSASSEAFMLLITAFRISSKSLTALCVSICPDLTIEHKPILSAYSVVMPVSV